MKSLQQFIAPRLEIIRCRASPGYDHGLEIDDLSFAVADNCNRYSNDPTVNAGR